MATISSEQPTQAFRFHPTNEIARIPAVVDADSRQRIVFWSAIKDVFRDSNLVMNGEVIVPFLEDEGFTQIIPLRIAYHPGVVLEVFEETMGTGSSSHNSSTQPIDVKQNPVIQMHLNNAHAILRQTYELYKHPLPRLFIVLPKTRQFSEKPLADDFRLYFLCECGTHTLPENCSTPHEIHLAKHEGYELEEPTKFFEEYGTYLLAMMYMVKCGINAAGMIVPVLAKLDIADDVVENLKDTDHLRKHAKLLVDATIDYLHELENDIEPGTGLSEYHADSDSLEALKGADLRQLESYLKIKDQGCVLGNLYRIVTQDGHVKWVCIDHYRTISKESAIQELRDIVAVNHGVFVEGTGKVEIKIATNTLAKQFYDALIKARVVQELEITLEWDATMEELQALANAVTRASVVHLVLNGTRIKGPALDFGNRSRRFDPIAQLAFNGRVQSLRLRGLEGFFSRVTSPALALTSKFREFSVDSRISHSDKAIKSCNEFLDHCPSLKRVELRFQKQYPVTKTVGDILGKLRKLKSLMFDRDNFSFAARVSEGNLQDMFLTIERLGSHGLEDFKFIRQSDLTQLHIKYTPQKADETQLVDVLRHNPRLYALRIGCAESRCLAILHLVISTRAALLQEERPCQLRTFELMDERLIPFEERGLYDERTLIHTSLSFAKDSLEFDMQTWIRLQCKSVVKEEDPITDFVREYGWSIVRLKIPQSFNDCFASTLYDITKEKGSRLEKVDLYPYSLTSRGLDHLDKIIDNSPSLVGFRLLLKPKNWAAEVEYTQLVLTRFGKRVTGLFFLGDTPEKWLPQIASSFPTRSCFPVLTELDLFLDMDTIPSNCVSWIATVVSTPPQHLEYPQQSSTSDVVEQPSSLTVRGSGTPTAGCTPLVRFTMERVILRPEEWGAVIKALDFSTLEVLSFAISNFSGEQLKLLVDRVPDSANETVPLRMLSVGESDVVKKADPRVLEGMLGILREKVPLISIKQ
ncbi:hypothetical protein BGX31_009934 [Mortierella sp. GBA43]|nr:hypothetical protein BGX31_009934 [Mortierella sp. GBA43]